METRFDYRNFHYWKLLRNAMHLSINECNAAITGSEQRYEILFDVRIFRARLNDCRAYGFLWGGDFAL